MVNIPFVLFLEADSVQRRRTRLERENERGIGKGALVMLREWVPGGLCLLKRQAELVTEPY
jgi:hypothetical protein